MKMKMNSKAMFGLILVAKSCTICFALQPPTYSMNTRASLSSSKTTYQIDMENQYKRFWGSAASAVAGLVFAGQIATASIQVQVDNPVIFHQQVPTLTLSAMETLDFSMPSYESAIKGSTYKPKDAPPAFNPFGEFEPEIVKPATTVTKPEIKIPEVKLPEVKTPEIPKFSMPSVDIPKASDFEMPKMDMPKMDMPKMDMPKMDMPKFDMPNFDMPKIDMPKMEMSKMDIPKVDMPKIDMPTIEMPKVSLPSFSLPQLGGGSSSTEDNKNPTKVLAAQAIRDEAARQAREDYSAADSAAKEVEAQAREMREIAKKKLQDAKVAKDLACETRPGGKLLCLRNPFTAGF